jgi:hypothetical protein
MENEPLLDAPQINGAGIQFRHIDEVMSEYGSSLKGLKKSDASNMRSRKGFNEVPTPINCPAWLCCLLPCLLRTPAMKQYNEAVPENASILRDGKWLRMDSNSVVPGDVLKHYEGDRIAADIRLIEASGNCQFDTRAIKYRSSPKIADPKSSLNNYEESPNMAFLGYLCISGECTGVAVATGADTMIGKMIVRKQWPPKKV